MRSLLRVELLEDRRLPTVLPIFLPQVRPETEPNDAPAQANVVKLTPLYPYYLQAADSVRLAYPWYGTYAQATVTGDLKAPVADGDVDYFSFTVAADRLIALTLTGDAVHEGITPTLLDSTGAAVAAVSTTGSDSASVSFYSREGGTFLAKIGPNVTSTAAYMLQISAAADPNNEHEPNDTLAQANRLDLTPYPIYWLRTDLAAPADLSIWYPWWNDRQSTSVSGTLGKGTSADVDYFSLNTAAERLISIALDGDALTSGATAELLDADGKVLATAQASAARPFSLSHFTKSGGSFFVRVGSPESATAPATGAYALDVTVATDPNNEHEPNDSASQANAIDLSSGYPWIIPLDTVVVTNSIAIVDPFPWEQGQGYIAGDLGAHAADEDYFSFSVPDKHTIHITLTGNLVGQEGRITLLDADLQVIAQDIDGADGLTIDATTTIAGKFYLQVGRSLSSSIDAASSRYRLDVKTAPVVNPVEGPDENEPNDALSQANAIELDDTCDDENLSLRTGAALGIVGGAVQDQDAYRFDVQAGEHVHVGVDGLVFDADGNVYANMRAWRRAGGKSGSSLQTGPVQIAVYDSSNNLIGTADDNGTCPGGVVFDVPVAGTYYVVVSSTSTSLVHYRLSVLASSQRDADSTDSAAQFVQTVRAGQSFDFLDASGDKVHVAYRGRGTATVTFTGPQANGSDIASIVIDGGRRGGLFVRTKGFVEVGQITIHDAARSFGIVRVDGDVGFLASQSGVKAVTVKGTLGGLYAPGQKIAEIKAYALDTALAEYTGSPKMTVQEDLNAIALHSLNPYQQQPTDPSISTPGWGVLGFWRKNSSTKASVEA